METQEIHTSDPCPKGIVNQLLEIAKENDAMNEIGGATGWRWQEGIISRMPKKRTVAKILKKSYKTDDPKVWIKKTSGDLNDFLRSAFPVEENKYFDLNPQDIYEAAIVLTLIDDVGFKLNEMVLRLSLLKYYKTYEEEEYLKKVDEDLILSLNGDWAKSKILDYMRYHDIKAEQDGYYNLGGKKCYPNSQTMRFQLEIMTIRHKMVEYNSHFDMWSANTVALTDDEMIELEYQMMDFQEQFQKKLNEITSRKSRIKTNCRTRFFSTSAISLPSVKGEVLKWKN